MGKVMDKEETILTLAKEELVDIVGYCNEKKLTINETSQTKKIRKGGVCYLVRDGKTEVGFWRKNPKEPNFLMAMKNEIIDYVTARDYEPFGIDAVKDFPRWVAHIAENEILIPLDTALEETKALDVRNLFAQVSGVGYDSFVNGNSLGFVSPSEMLQKLPSVPFDFEED